MAVFMPTGEAKQPAHAYALEGFDRAVFEQSRTFLEAQKDRDFIKPYRSDPMNPEVLNYWEKLGCRKELYDNDYEDGRYQYSVFTPTDMEPGKKYAVLYISHGGGSDNFMAEAFGFNRLIKSERIICIYANNGGKSNEEVEPEFRRILTAMLERKYPIDEERIYAVGFSAGADATGVLASAWPELIAGVAPMPGGNVFEKGGHYASEENYAKNLNREMPLICIAGTMDGGDVYPLTSEHAFENFNIWMEQIVKIAGYEKQNMALCAELQRSGNPTERVFGFKFQKTWEQKINDLHYYCGEFYNNRGIAAARFISAEGIPHMMPAASPKIAWDFLKHFRRNQKSCESLYDPIVINGERYC